MGRVAKVSGTNRSLITGYIVLTLMDRDGRVLLKRAKEFNSFVKNFLAMLERMLKGYDTVYADLYKLNDVTPVQLLDGTEYVSQLYPGSVQGQEAYGWAHGYRVDADAGDKLLERNEPTDWGIIVGSDYSPTTINMYSLISPYPHGRGAGYMNYMSTEVSEPEFDGSYVKIVIRRLIANESDTTQQVGEVGLIVRELYTWKKWLIAREAIDPPIQMPPRSILDVTIVIAGLLAPYNIYYVSDYSTGFESSSRATV